MQYSAYRIQEEFSGLFLFFKNIDLVLKKPNSVSEGLGSMNLLYVWLMVLDTSEYPVLFEKAFTLASSRSIAPNQADVACFRKICKDLGYFLITERQLTLQIVTSTLNLKNRYDLNARAMEHSQDGLTSVFNDFDPKGLNYLQQWKELPIVKMTPLEVSIYAKYVAITRDRILPQMLLFWGKLEPYFSNTAFYESFLFEIKTIPFEQN